MKRLLIIIGILLLATQAQAVELIRQRNTQTVIAFPINYTNAAGNVTGAAGLDSEYSYWNDTTSPAALSDLTNEAAEIAASSGWYYLTLTAAETNHEYVLVEVNTSTSDADSPVPILIRTMVGDPQYAASVSSGYSFTVDAAGGNVYADTREIGGTAQTANDVGGDVNDILDDTAAMDTSSELRTLLTDSDTAVSTLTTSDNIGINWADIDNPTTAVDLSATDIQLCDTVTDVSNAVSISSTTETQIDNIEADTNELQTNQGNWATATGFMPDTEDGSSFTAVPWNASWDAEVQSEVSDGLNAIKLHYWFETAVATPGGITEVTANSIAALMMASDGNATNYSYVTDSQEGIRDQGDAAWTTY